MADEQAIAEALLRCKQVARSLPPEDGEGLVRLIVRESCIDQFDPDKDKWLSSDSTSIGSAGMSQTRTFWGHTLILAIPFPRWGAEPYVVDPTLFPSGILSRIVSVSHDRDDHKPIRTHPCQQACLWRQEMDRDPRITKARIAAREGISRARVTHIMNLLELPEEIQEGLKHPPVPLEISSFSERSPRQIMACGDRESQLRRRQELIYECQILVRK